MLALISSIIASIQLNHAIIDTQENYKRRRLNLSRLLSTTTSTFTRGDLTTWTLTLDNKALKQRLQAQIDSACAFGV